MKQKEKEKNSNHSGVPGNYWITSWRPFAILVILSAVLFGRTVDYGYTNCDDNMLIVDDFNSISAPAKIIPAFHTPYLDDYYRPAVIISLILDAQISGQTPWMYHLTNIVLHALAGCLLFVLLLRLRFSRVAAMVAGMVFIVNPIVTQAVAWIPGRNDSLVAIFMLLSFISFIRFTATKGCQSLGGHFLFLFAALLTKESALVLPILLFIYYIFVVRESFISRGTARLLAGWGVILCIWFLLRWWAFTGVQHAGGAYSISTVGTVVRVMVEMLGKMILPVHMSGYPTFNSESFIAGIGVVMAIGIILLKFPETRNRLSLFGLFWVVFFIVVGSAVHVVDTAQRFHYLECRAYASLVGLAIFLAGILQSGSSLLKRWTMRCCMIAIPIYIIMAWMYSPSYRDPVSYWTNAIQTSPDAAEAHFNLGVVYHIQESNPATACRNYAQATALDPGNSIYHDNFGFALNQLGRAREAEDEFLKAIRADSLDPYPRIHLASMYLTENRFTEAENVARASFRLDSNSVGAVSVLVDLFTMEGKYDSMRFYNEKLKALLAQQAKE